MDDQPTKRNVVAGAVLIVSAILILLPVLYVLAAGPLSWLDEHGYLSQSVSDTLQLLYVPLAWLAEAVPAFGSVLEAYGQLWKG